MVKIKVVLEGCVNWPLGWYCSNNCNNSESAHATFYLEWFYSQPYYASVERILKRNAAPLSWLLDSIYFGIQKSYIFVSCSPLKADLICNDLCLCNSCYFAVASPFQVTGSQPILCFRWTNLEGKCCSSFMTPWINLFWNSEKLHFCILLPFKRRFDMQRFMSLQFLLFCSLANSIEKDQRSFHKIFLNCNTP